MSVLWIGGQRFAVGLEWQRGLVAGRGARQLARQRRRPWTVDVAGQTGFLDEAEGPEGTKPLAGAISAFLRMQAAGFENWIAFIREDGQGETDLPGQRVAVVRCNAGSLFADGDRVFASMDAAMEAVGEAAVGDVAVVASSSLQFLFSEALTVDGKTLRQAAADVAVISPVRTGGVSRKSVVWSVVAAMSVAMGFSLWTNRVALGVRLGLIEEEKKERPKVRVLVETDRFLGYCRNELARREMWMAGFERIAVYCHSAYAPRAGISPPKKMKGRAVLEVFWQLREPLSPRVYGRLAEQLLDRWYWSGVNDEGQAVGISALPPVLAKTGKMKREPVPHFRARVDGMFPLRGFEVEYRWGKKNEVTLTTARPFAQAVSMIGGVPGIEIVSAAWEKGLWRFEGRRTRPRNMFEDEFEKLSKPLVAGEVSGRKAA